jgi:hypothetical protein
MRNSLSDDEKKRCRAYKGVVERRVGLLISADYDLRWDDSLQEIAGRGMKNLPKSIYICE